jgi:hypothetical protein
MPKRITLLLALGLYTFALGAPISASASPPPIITAQAKAANASFLAYAPAPASSGAMCLIDTGINQTPDTTPTLAYATALDGGTPNDTDPEGHGTLMAILAGGQGHGLRGIWPQIKIVSIRAASTPALGQAPAYQYASYVEGLQRCLEHSSLEIKTVNLSLSSTIPPTPDQSQAFAEGVSRATARGIAIVAAAGNAPGRVQYPGAEPGVLSVGADDISGGICSFSASEGVGLFAPGCELEFADPLTDEYNSSAYVQGTSEASDVTDTSLTALMDYAPALTVAEAENLFVTTAVDGHLDVAGAFEAAGLGSVVAAGNAAIPPEPSPAIVPPPTHFTPTKSIGVPSASIRSVAWVHGILTVRLRSLPKGASVHVLAQYTTRRAHGATSTTTTLRLRCPRPSEVSVWVAEGNAAGPASKIALRVRTKPSNRTHRAKHTSEAH